MFIGINVVNNRRLIINWGWVLRVGNHISLVNVTITSLWIKRNRFTTGTLLIRGVASNCRCVNNLVSLTSWCPAVIRDYLARNSINHETVIELNVRSAWSRCLVTGTNVDYFLSPLLNQAIPGVTTLWIRIVWRNVLSTMLQVNINCLQTIRVLSWHRC